MVDWNKVEKVDPATRGAWFPYENASYEVEVKGVRTTTQGGTNQDFFIVETNVLASNTPSVKEGEARSWVVNLSNAGAFDAPFRDVKAFCCAALGIAAADAEAAKVIGKKAMEFITGTEQPFSTLRLRMATTEGKTKEGGDFTRHAWQCADPEQSAVLLKYFQEKSLLVAVAA